MNQTYDPYLKPDKMPDSERQIGLQGSAPFGRLPSVLAVLSMIVLVGWMIHIFARTKIPAGAEFDNGSNVELYRATVNETSNRVPFSAVPVNFEISTFG